MCGAGGHPGQYGKCGIQRKLSETKKEKNRRKQSTTKTKINSIRKLNLSK